MEAATSAEAYRRLRWQCRRGMLELDLLLAGFLDDGYERLDATGRARFAELLGYPDPLLQGWLMGHATPADAALAELVAIIRGGEGGGACRTAR